MGVCAGDMAALQTALVRNYITGLRTFNSYQLQVPVSIFAFYSLRILTKLAFQNIFQNFYQRVK